jgi:protocatechuate 3,4-dioxygenase beta subunit
MTVRPLSRRTLLGAALALPITTLAPLAARAQEQCGAPTPRDSEGPFYKPGAPRRASLVEPGAKAPRMVLTGRVLAADCGPLAGATLDFWHAGESGDYDHDGFRYRGVAVADAEGRYRLETNLPPPYAGRPRHIHVKVGRPGGRTLTTQLYFPGESRGAPRELVVRMERREGVLHAEFDFVLGG